MQKHLYGLSGQEEQLALKSIKEQKQDWQAMGDDCLFEEDDRFDEQSHLEECAFSTYGEI